MERRPRFSYLKFFFAELHERSAWQAVTAACAFNAVGMIVNLRLGSQVADFPSYGPIFSMVVAFCLLCILFLIRKNPSRRIVCWIYVVNVVAVSISLALSTPAFAVAGEERWVPFQANKLGCLIGAMLSPSFSLGLLAVFLHAGSAVLQFFLFSDIIRSNIAHGEPQATIAFALGGLFTLVYRFNHVATERRLLKAVGEAENMQKFVDISLRLRDLMNTPLQTLRIAAALLRDPKTAQKQGDIVGKVERAVDQLADINKLLIEHEAKDDTASELHQRLARSGD